MRWQSWTFDPDPADSTVVSHFVYMMREHERLTVEHDVHICGLFARELWLRLLRKSGFQTRIVVDSYHRDLLVALKPATA